MADSEMEPQLPGIPPGRNRVEKPARMLRVATMGASETFGIYESPDGMAPPPGGRPQRGISRSIHRGGDAAFSGMGLESACITTKAILRPCMRM